MDTLNFENVEIERCTGCKGLWFDQSEAEAMKAIQNAEMLDLGVASIGREFNGQEPIHCPRCSSVELRRKKVPDQAHIEIDSCPSCHGSFFDAGEFTDFKQKDVLDIFKGFISRFR
jgi:Zn-finger nucleic acid-binding protein